MGKWARTSPRKERGLQREAEIEPKFSLSLKPVFQAPSEKRAGAEEWKGGLSPIFSRHSPSPDHTRLIFAWLVLFSRRPYYLRAWHKLFFLTWPSQPVIKIQPWPSPAWKHKMYKEQVGDSYGMKDLFISLSKREGKWETSVYKQTTLVKVQVVLFYFYNLWNDNKWYNMHSIALRHKLTQLSRYVLTTEQNYA